jgi:fructan beta-fructosidase
VTWRVIPMFGLLCVLASACLAAQDSPLPSEGDPYRPQYHFSAPRNWLNDPNGLVYFQGEYHLFYQHNPFENRWGNLSWGHAVASDPINWQNLPVAIAAEPDLLAFSGSVVVDAANTSGLGQGGPPLVALYTGFRISDRSQAQYLAYSNDRGRTWTRFGNEPVLRIDSLDFRDPKIFWHAPTGRWIMAVALAVERKVQFYASSNLKFWTFLSEFGPAGPESGPWEVPDLIELPLDGGQTRWVLNVSVIEGGPAGGSGMQYFVGDFDGTRFVADGSPRWTDYGKDFYAALSWSNLPSSQPRPIWLAWMNNWQYTANLPTEPWRGAMSAPRALSLVTIDGRARLVQQPVRELEGLRGAR